MFTYIKTFIHRHSDWNPVSLRELRRVTNSGVLAWTICLSALGLSLVFLTYMVHYEGVVRHHRGTTSVRDTEEFFFCVLGIIAGVTALVTLLNTFFRCIIDRIREDPMFYSLITPVQVVRGRIISTAITSVVMYSVALPFLVLTYNLRGIEFNAIIISVAITFIWTQIINLVTTAFFVGVRGVADAVIYLVPWGFCVFFAVMMTICSIMLTIELSNDYIAMAIFYMMVAIFGILLTWLAYSLAVAALIPETCNRMFRTRFGVTVILLPMVAGMVYYFLNAVMTSTARNELPAITFAIYNLTGVVLFSFLSLVAVCERHDYPLRQRREIPRLILSRLLYFPFSSGVPNAFVWIGMMMIVWHGSSCYCVGYLYAMGYLLNEGNWGSHRSVEVYQLIFRQLLTPLLYIYGYSIVTVWLYKMLLWRYWKQKYLWLMVFIVIAVVGMVSFTMEFNWGNEGYFNSGLNFRGNHQAEYGKRLAMSETQILLAPNPLTIIDIMMTMNSYYVEPIGYRVIQFIFASGLSLIGFVTMLIWAAERFVRKFYRAK